MPNSKDTYSRPSDTPRFAVREDTIEYGFVGKLQSLKYEYRDDIRDRAALEKNFREKFEALNRVRLTDAEFARLLDEIVTPDVFTAAKTLRSINAFRVTRGEVLSMTLVKDAASNEAPFPVYSSQTKNKGLAGYYSEHLYEDAITWTTDGANAGDVNFRPGKFYCTNVCGVLINTHGYANACVAALLNSVTRSHVSYVGNPKLMNGVMAKIEIPFPPLPEQQRIASCLSSLDTLITAETQKLEALNRHKRGLMQQLFPSPEELEA